MRITQSRKSIQPKQKWPSNRDGEKAHTIIMNARVHAKTYSLPLRSKLLDWLESSPQKVATAQQWQGILNNLQNVRREEIERAELTDFGFYYEADQRIGKEKLIEEAACNLWHCAPTIHSNWRNAFCPSLDVKTITGKLPSRVELKAKQFVEKAQTCYQHPSLGYWIIRTAYEDLATTAPNWIVLDHKGKMVVSHEKHRGWFPSAVEAFDEMHRVIRNRFEKFGSDRPVTLYDEYTFMGGKNYQEWFVCLPDWPLPYRDGHFQLDQLLIHIRTTERIDHDGRPFLMIEEIQSPWHADIRENGSSRDEAELEEDNDLVADAPFGKEWHELAIKAAIWLAIKQGYDHLGFTTGKQQCERWYEMEGLMNLYDLHIPKCLKRIAAQYACVNDWATIVTRRPDSQVRRSGHNVWAVNDANDNPLTPPLKNKDVALFFLNQCSTPAKEQIRLLQISPALKSAMNAGQIPLFGW